MRHLPGMMEASLLTRGSREKVGVNLTQKTQLTKTNLQVLKVWTCLFKLGRYGGKTDKEYWTLQEGHRATSYGPQLFAG